MIGSRRNFLKSTAWAALGSLFVPRYLAKGQTFRYGPDGFRHVNAKTSAWANLVVANGGARPRGTTLTAVDAWYNSLVSAGIDSLIINASFIAPDSLIAANTPFFHTAGLTHWTGSILSGFDVTGLQCGNGCSAPQTGCDPSVVFTAGDMGLIAYGARPGATPQYAWGGGNGVNCAEIWSSNINGGSQVASYSTWNLSPSSAGAVADEYIWFAAFRTATNVLTSYWANSRIGWVNSGTSASGGSPPAGSGAAAIGFNTGGSCAGISVCGQFSFLAVTHGMTTIQGQALFNATQTLRQAFGGGYT